MSAKREKTDNTPVAMSTSSTQFLISNSPLKGTRDPREIAEFRTEAGNIQDEAEASCSVRK